MPNASQRPRLLRPWPIALAVLLGLSVAGGLALHRAANPAWLSKVLSEPLPSGSRKTLEAIVDTKKRLRTEKLRAAGDLAKLYLANGYDAQALELLGILETQEPTVAVWSHFRARLLAGTGSLDEALPAAERAVALAPDYLPACVSLAEIRLKRNEPAAAQALFESVLQRSPANPNALLGLARLALSRQDWKTAHAFLDRAIERVPRFSAAHSLLATVLEAEGDHRAAVTEGRRGKEMGLSNELQDPWTEALLEVCTDSYRLRIAASRLLAAGDAAQAAGLLERAAALDPANGKLCRELGDAYLILHYEAKAREWLEKSIAAEPAAPEAYLSLVHLLKKRGELLQGFAWLQRGLAACPRAATLHWEYAQVMHAQGRFADETEHLEQCVQLAPENISPYFELAMQYFRSGRDDKGLTLLEAAHAREPDNFTALTLLTKYHVIKNHPTEARAFRKLALEAGAPPESLPPLE